MVPMLPPWGRARRPAAPTLPSPDSAPVTMQYAKGYIGARCLARDDNADLLQTVLR
jgi:hypothetical protein